MSIKTLDILAASKQVSSWKFENLKKTQPTNLQIFGGNSNPAIIIPIGDESIHIVTGHDTDLDSLIQEYDPGLVKIVLTDDEADKLSLETTEFQPAVLKSLVQLVILFIKSEQAQPGQTYWLYKDKDCARIYNLSSLYPLNMDCEKESNKSSYIIPVASLFYHLAIKVENKRVLSDSKNRYKHIHLINTCVSLLKTDRQTYLAPDLLTDALYLFSMWCLIEGSLITHSGNNFFADFYSSGMNEQLKMKNLSEIVNDIPLGQVFKSYIKNCENEMNTIVKSPAAPSFAHIPLALDIAFRGLEVSYNQFKKSSVDKFHLYVCKHPVVLKLINYTKMVCTALAQQHLQSNELSYALTYVSLGLHNQELLELLSDKPTSPLASAENSINQNNGVSNAMALKLGLHNNDLFFCILILVAGEIHYSLAKKLLRDQSTLQNFYAHFDKSLNANDRYFSIIKSIHPLGGEKYDWATTVLGSRKQLFACSGQCFTVVAAQNEWKRCGNNHNKNLHVKSICCNGTSNDKEDCKDFMSCSGKNGNRKKMVSSGNSSGSFKLSSCNFTLQPNKTDFIVDVLDPFIFITSENDLTNPLDSEEDFKKAYATLEKALATYQTLQNAPKEMLVYAKLALVTRINAVWLKGQNTRLLFKREQELLQKAVEYFNCALVVLQMLTVKTGDKGKKEVVLTDIDVHNRDAINWNLGDTYYQLANRLLNNLQEMHTTKEMESQMFDYLTKSIEIWGYFTENLSETSNNLKMARNRIAESHHMLACQHNQAFLEKGGGLKLINFRMAIQHYQKAAKYFSLAVMPTAEFFSRVGILNLLASQFAPAMLSGPAKIKLLDDCFGDVYACSPCLEEIVKNLERVSRSPEAEIQSDENLLYSPTFCQNLHSWFSIFSYIITTIFKHSVQSGVSSTISNSTRMLFKEAYDHVLRILQDADLLGIQGGRALSTEISTELLLKKAHALVRAIEQTPQCGPGSTDTR